MRAAAIVLAGGRSRRMGVAKADLRFGSETLLARTVRIVSETASDVVVVAGPGQELPPLPVTATILRDRQEGRGPLEGIAVGLSRLQPFELAFITGCDTPLLTPEFVRGVIELVRPEDDAAVPMTDGLSHPLAGAYRPSILPQVEQMLADNCLRLTDLLDRIRTRRIGLAELRTIDPELGPLRNVNTPDDYATALAAAGLRLDN